MADVISFRASYETEAHWRILPNVKSALSVAEAKVLIARELGLEREFARTFDLELYDLEPAADASADRSRLLSDDDNNLILLGSRLIVNRVLWGQVPHVVHSSSKAVGAWVKGEETKQQRDEELPDGLKCARCRNLARNPLLARCTRGCTKSVCKACAELLVAGGIPAECPVCNQRSVASFVPNRTLAVLVARIDAPPANGASGGSALTESGGDSLKTNRRATNLEDPNDMWLLFVDPSQMAIVHRDGFVVLPWQPQDPFCQKTKDPITLCVMATGGGGTSIVSPGTCRVQRLWYCNNTASEAPEAGAAAPPAGNTPNLQPLIDLWFKDCSEDYRRRFSNGDGFVIMELQWLSRYPTPVLLPGKAQPIAGILASAPKDAYVINLTNAQKQGVTQRLYNEAHFARCSGSAPAPLGLGTILARLNRSATAANEERAREAVEKIWNVYKSCNIWTGTHWNRMLRMNPLIPWTATIPKLSEAQFNMLRFLQQLALHLMDPRAPKPQAIPKIEHQPEEKRDNLEKDPPIKSPEVNPPIPQAASVPPVESNDHQRWKGRRARDAARNQSRNNRHHNPRSKSHFLDEKKAADSRQDPSMLPPSPQETIDRPISRVGEQRSDRNYWPKDRLQNVRGGPPQIARRAESLNERHAIERPDRRENDRRVQQPHSSGTQFFSQDSQQDTQRSNRRFDEPPRRSDGTPRRADEPSKRAAEPPRRVEEPPRRSDEPQQHSDEPPRRYNEPARRFDGPPRLPDGPIRDTRNALPNPPRWSESRWDTQRQDDDNRNNRRPEQPRPDVQKPSRDEMIGNDSRIDQLGSRNKDVNLNPQARADINLPPSSSRESSLYRVIENSEDLFEGTSRYSEDRGRRRRLMEDRITGAHDQRSAASLGANHKIRGANHSAAEEANHVVEAPPRRPPDRRRVIIADNNNISESESTRPKSKRPRNTLFSS